MPGFFGVWLFVKPGDGGNEFHFMIIKTQQLGIANDVTSMSTVAVVGATRLTCATTYSIPAVSPSSPLASS